MFTFEYELTHNDFLTYQYFIIKHSHKRTGADVFSWYIIPMLPVSMLLFSFFLINNNVYYLMSIITILIYLIHHIRKVVFKGRQSQRGNVPAEESEITMRLVFSDDEIIYENNTVHAKFNWSSVKNIVEYKQYVYVFLEETGGIIIPVGVFNDGISKEDFITYVNKRFSENAGGA